MQPFSVVVKASLVLSRRDVTLRVSCCNLSRGWSVTGSPVVSFHSVIKKIVNGFSFCGMMVVYEEFCKWYLRMGAYYPFPGVW